jgi:hypothetical protein
MNLEEPIKRARSVSVSIGKQPLTMWQLQRHRTSLLAVWHVSSILYNTLRLGFRSTTWQCFSTKFNSTKVRFYQSHVLPKSCSTKVMFSQSHALPKSCSTKVMFYQSPACCKMGFYQIPFYQSHVLPKSGLLQNGILPNSVLTKSVPPNLLIEYSELNRCLCMENSTHGNKG